MTTIQNDSVNAPIWIPHDRFSLFEKKFSALVRTARRLQVPEPSYEVVKSESRLARGAIFAHEVAHPELIPRRQWDAVVLSGSAPRIEGFKFVAAVEKSRAAEQNMIFTLPGSTADLRKFRSAALECEHCQLKRDRAAIFVIQDQDTGSLHAVGRSCLRDFTGHVSPEQVAAFATALFTLASREEDGSEDWARGRVRDLTYSTIGFLEMTAAVVDEFGWTPGGVTRDLVLNALSRQGIFEPGISVPKIEPRHVVAAKEALEWVRSLATDPISNPSDYLLNLLLALRGDVVGRKEFGLAASAIAAHARHLEREVKKAQRAAADEAAADIPEFSGRARITGTIVSTKWRETDFGPTLKMLVRHADGWKVWGSVPSSLGTVESNLIGKTVEFHARVERSNDDPKFGFFSRPTKAKVTS